MAHDVWMVRTAVHVTADECFANNVQNEVIVQCRLIWCYNFNQTKKNK